jgi:predicted DNA-binding transcriptional regulator YafY
MNRIDRLFAMLLVLQTRQRVRVEDLAKQFEISQRTVEPHYLTYGDGVWYLSGFCRLRQEMRSFRLFCDFASSTRRN